MNEVKEYTEKLFEDIKHIDENGNEYWLACELMPLLKYSKWERFSNAIVLAQTYFAIQTRSQELSKKEYIEITEDEKRFY